MDYILGDPGATSRDEGIFSGESLLQELKSPWELIFLPNQFQKWKNSVPLIGQKRKIFFWPIRGIEFDQRKEKNIYKQHDFMIKRHRHSINPSLHLHIEKGAIIVKDMFTITVFWTQRPASSKSTFFLGSAATLRI